MSNTQLTNAARTEERIQQVEHDLQPFGDTTHVLGSRHLSERMRYYGVPGVSIAVINDSALDWIRGYGVRDIDGDAPVTPQTCFPAASISKPLVAMAVLRLVQEGVLDLDSNVNHYLTSWKLPPSPHTQDRKVTLRSLLSHGAGTTLYGFWGYRPHAPIPTLLQVLDGLPPANSVPVRVDVTPGSRWRYSSGGYCIVEQLLVDVLDTSFPDALQALVLAPLGMERSAFCASPTPALAANMAHGHDPTGASIPDKWRVHPELGAIGFWSTPRNIAKFVIEVQHSQQGHSNKVLSTEMTRHMLTVQISNWALGPAIDGEGHAARFAHGGAAIGFRCYLIGYCHRGQGAIVMTNGDRGDHLCVKILHSIARAYAWPDYYHYLDQSV